MTRACWPNDLAIRYDVIPIQPPFECVKQQLTGRVCRAPRGHDGGKHPGALARRHLDGAVQQIRLPAVDDRQQERIGRGLLHALRRHVRRPGGHQRCAQDDGLSSGPIGSTASGEIIPIASITKPPSAELRPNQTDQDSLPPYEVLDAILDHYVVYGRSFQEIVEFGFDEATVKRVIRLIDINEYKRRQAAPGLKVTTKAFGVGRRFPIAQRYREV